MVLGKQTMAGNAVWFCSERSNGYLMTPPSLTRGSYSFIFVQVSAYDYNSMVPVCFLKLCHLMLNDYVQAHFNRKYYMEPYSRLHSRDCG
jgi:hypothetical protein